MFMRIDKLLTDIPMPKGQDQNAGPALQELWAHLANHYHNDFRRRRSASAHCRPCQTSMKAR